MATLGNDVPPPLIFSGKEAAFGDLDENQDYFPYEEYSDELKDPEAGIPAVVQPPTQPTSPKTVAIKLLKHSYGK